MNSNAARAKQDLARPNNRDSPNAKRQQELKSELKKIGELQRGSMSGRNAIFEKMKKLDEQIKFRQNELKTAKGRINFRTVKDVDREIDRLQKQVDTSTMKIVDEKKVFSEISNLRKARKNFATFDQMQKAIDELRVQHSEQKKLLDDIMDPSSNRRIQAQYNPSIGNFDENGFRRVPRKVPQNAPRKKIRPQRRPITAATIIGCGAFAVPLVGGMRLFCRGITWPLMLTSVMSLATFIMYGFDKYRSRNSGWRVRETTMHLFEMLGGWPGALLGQHYFQHKTMKKAFQAQFWIIVGIHQLLWFATWRNVS
ncbi:DUF1294-domain-containing protein [Mytilinidion resinicola]|uniref:DUF1294-domain-containing protein n=1 Tax=Mytilinidion resinicola TaxID=574789 RepID=A0A6A6YB59_9PEZI|nr:DUF1294-domain-containing protein [Mytilinidion resinicola]KAF2806066.1 DUF1294-domain-containing protein [Mytilinidion resinicola]